MNKSPGAIHTEADMSDEAMRLGLLMEAAQAQQRLSQESLEQLAAHTRDLDTVVREEVRRTVAEELGALAGESRRTAESLQRMRRAANLRVVLWSMSATLISSAVAFAMAWWLLPSQGEIAALRSRRDALTAEIVRLKRSGALLDVRRCGDARLCVRIDRNAPAYGPRADYRVVKGY